jgi:hypothetical protein
MIFDSAVRWNAVLAGIALGMLGRRALHAIDRIAYGLAREYRSDAHNLRGLFDWEAKVVDAYFAGRPRLALIGAGAGREALALSRRGYRVDAFECNPALLAAANRLLGREGVDVSVRHLPRDAAPSSALPYDGVVIGWTAYMHVLSSRTRIELLRGLRRLLPTDAPLLLSFFTRPEPDEHSEVVCSVANRVRAALRREPVERGDELVPGYVHRFTRAEIVAELDAGGFLLQCYADEGPGDHDSGFAVGRAC